MSATYPDLDITDEREPVYDNKNILFGKINKAQFTVFHVDTSGTRQYEKSIQQPNLENSSKKII